MKKIHKVISAIFIFLVVIIFNNNAFAATENEGQNLGVTVDNSLVVVPETPTILSVDNVGIDTLDLVVEVQNDFSGFASETLDYVVTITNKITGDITTANFSQLNDSNARTTLNISGLDPGTDYDFTVRYKRSGGVFSGDSLPASATTLINSPVLDSIDGVTTEAVNLNVIIDPVFVGYPMDFIVEVSNGGVYTVQMTKTPTGSNVDLLIDSLDADTEYTFKVRYAREGSMNFSDYSNELTVTTEANIPDVPSIDSIVNITTSSVELIVSVEGQNNENLDLVVEVTNVDTGAVFTVDFSKTVNGGGEVTLGISGLNSGTEYSFKVKAALDGESEYSNYSSSENATTVQGSSGEVIEICFNDSTITVPREDLQSYLDQGAVTGPCSDVKVIICHKGKTISVAQSAVPGHLAHGDELGECPISGGSTEIDNEIIVDDNAIDDGIIISSEKKEELKEAIIPEEKKNNYQKAAIAGAAAGTTAALAGSAVPLFAAMPGAFGTSIFLQFIELFGIIGRRKEERNWGVVFDKDTKTPIPAVKIVLLDKMGKEMATTYSDKDGRFGFLVHPGDYIINVFKKNYTLITDESNDELYGSVYDGKTVAINEEHIMLSNIAMRAEGINWQEYADQKATQYNSKWSVFKKYFFAAIYYIGFGATIVITYFYPSIFNFIVLGVYVSLFIYQKFFKKKKYGLVETNDGKPIPFAVVNLYDKETTSKEGFAVTDSIGRYYLLANNGEYGLKAKGQPLSGKQFEKSGNVNVTDGIVRKDIIV